jgi:hypothetical protein
LNPLKLFRDFKEITKAGLAVSVVFSSIAGYLLCISEAHPFNWMTLLVLAVGGYCMVGASNAFFGWEGNSLQYAKPILEKVWGTAHNIGSGKYFNYTQVGGIDDDHLYVNRAGIPTIDIIHFDATGSFPDHHHTHKDNMNVIDRNTLKAVGQTVLEVLYNEK